MLLQTSSITTVITILNVVALVLFTILGGIKLKQSKSGNPYNILLSVFFFSVVAGLFVNIYYAVSSESMDTPTYLFYIRLSTFLIAYSCTFPLFFQYVLFQGFAGISLHKKILFFAVSLILYGLIFIVGEISLDPDRRPIYNAMLMYYIFVLVAGSLLLFLILTKILLKFFSNPIIKKKYGLFVLGYVIFSIVLFSTISMNSQVISRAFGTAIFSLLMLPSVLLIYLGIGRKME